MKKALFLLFLCSCAMSGKVVTMDSFCLVDISQTQEEVVKSLGKPYAIHQKSDGMLEYEYIERIKIGAREAENRHYFIGIKNGVVVSKRVEQSSPLPFGFDSYEMQTTEN